MRCHVAAAAPQWMSEQTHMSSRKFATADRSINIDSRKLSRLKTLLTKMPIRIINPMIFLTYTNESYQQK